jgi:hypothetical protein
MSDDLWNKLRDVLNEMEAAGIPVQFGSQQDSSTGWWSIPYVVSSRTCNIEIIWDSRKKQWKRGRD